MIVNPDKDVIVGVGGQISAPLVDSQNYVITSGMASISNFVQWGNDLIVQFSSGGELRINNFFINGPNFHKLMLVENGKRIEVDFSKALTSEGDGIDDSQLQYTQVGESLSVKTLLGILGGAAVGGAGLYSVFDKNDDNKSTSNGTTDENSNRPSSPKTNVMNDDKDPSEIIRFGASTNDNTPTLEGDGAIPGAKIAIRVNDGDPIYVIADQNGKWSYTFPTLDDGIYNIVITQTDANGKTSEETKLQFTIDTVAPEVPELESVVDNVTPIGIIGDGGITNDATPEFKGTAEAGSKISIYVDGEVVGTTTTGSDGKWSIELGKNLSDGEHKVQITATDAAGNESDKTEEFTFTVDTIPPAPINANSIYWGDSNGGELTQFVKGTPVNTNLRKIVLEGTANAVGSGYDAKWIEVYDNGVSLGKAEIGSDGKWRFSPTEDLGFGSHNFSFEAVDAAGNRSPRTNVEQFIVSPATTPNSTDISDITNIFDDGLISSNDNDELSETSSAQRTQNNNSSAFDYDNSSSSEKSNTSETTQEVSKNTYSYKVGNFMDGSDATANNQTSSIDNDDNASNITASSEVNNDLSEPTSDILGEIGINVNNDNESTDIQNSQINYDNTLEGIGLNDLLNDTLVADNQNSDNDLTDFASSNYPQSPSLHDEQYLNYI